nr:mucin-13 [Vicugna pacos]
MTESLEVTIREAQWCPQRKGQPLKKESSSWSRGSSSPNRQLGNYFLAPEKQVPTKDCFRQALFKVKSQFLHQSFQTQGGVSPPPPSTGTTGTTASSPPPPSTGTTGTTASSPPPPSTGAAGTTVTKGPTNPCQEDSCKGGSLCVSLNDTFFCLCPEGQYYNSSTCSKGKIFPGTITFKTSNVEDLEDENSVAYQKLHFEITEFFKKAFNNSDYGQTVIVKISLRTSSARSELRAGDKAIITTIEQVLYKSPYPYCLPNSSLNSVCLSEQDRCDYYGCEKKDQDNCASGLLCQCKSGLVRPNPQIPMCVALSPTCDDTCNAENKQQCLVRSNRSADCVCLPGYREDSHGACQPCAFGYSGVGCKDSE